MKKRKLLNKWSIFSENHSRGYIVLMLLGINILFICGAMLLIAVLPENKDYTPSQLAQMAFTLMVNPSGKYIYGESPISRIFTTVVVLMGMISLTGGAVGFVTSVISGFMEKAANSKRPLKLKDHIVILNYNKRVPAILCDYCFDDADNTFLVILTDEDRDAVMASIDEMYNRMGRTKRFKNVIVRSGSPLSPLELERINLASANTVLLMTPESAADEDPDQRGFMVSKLFLSVTTFLESHEDNGTEIVVETSTEAMDNMVRDYSLKGARSRVISVNHDMMIGKMLGVTTIMPGINGVLRQLFSFEGIEIYTRDIPSVSVEEELTTSRSVMPLLDQGDHRVYLAESEEEFDCHTEPFRLTKPVPAQKIVPNLQFTKNEIIIVGINRKLPYILESLSCFKKKYDNRDLHAILADTPDRMDAIRAMYADPRYTDVLMPECFSPVCIHNLYRPMDDLGAVVDSSADTLLFLSEEDVTSRHVDEKPLLYWSDIRSHMSSEPDVIVEIQDPANQSILERKNRDQILVSDDFLGRLYAQLGKNPLRKDIIMDMITSEGDSGAVTLDNEEQDAGDLICLKAGVLLGLTEPLTFTSKREMVLWTMAATNGKVMPIGCAKQNVPYLFARTDGPDDGLDSCVLLGIREGQVCNEPIEKLVLKPEDEVIAFVFS